MMRWRVTLALLTALAMLAACGTPRLPEEKPVSERQRPAQVGPVSSTPVPPLVPQAEGTPLPAREPRIGERWPLEIKRLVDNMLTLYPRTPGERPPSVKDVEKKMGITLTERPLTEAAAISYSKQYTVSGTPYVDPDARRFGLGDRYNIRRARPPGGMTQHLQLVIGPQQSGFCLDPYELAVYTGSTFVNNDNSPHAAIRQWSPAYVWGMFRWSNTGHYGGQGFSIVVGADRDPDTHQVVRSGCVANIAVYGGYQEEGN